MTAPASTVARTALRRADHTWCRDTADDPLDPARLDYLAAAVEPVLAEAQQAAHTWEGEYERVRDDQLVDVAEHAELKAERDALVERLAVAERERAQACERLAEASLRIAEMQVEVGRIVEKAGELAAAADPPHRHAWEWQPGLKAMPLPCACGQPWPRDRQPGGA